MKLRHIAVGTLKTLVLAAIVILAGLALGLTAGTLVHYL